MSNIIALDDYICRSEICLIIATAANGVVGSKGKLPWNVPSDLAFFREKTWNKPVICGRKTAETLPMLENRNVYVLSAGAKEVKSAAGGRFYDVFADLKAAAASAASIFGRLSFPAAQEIFIIGGAETFRRALDTPGLVDRVYWTRIGEERALYDGDCVLSVPEKYSPEADGDFNTMFCSWLEDLGFKLREQHRNRRTEETDNGGAYQRQIWERIANEQCSRRF